MRVYTAHLHARKPPVLVREGFSWGGLFFSPLWLLWHRAWLPFAVVLAMLVAVCAALPPATRPFLCFAVFVLTGFFGNDARRASLGLRRFRLAHVVAARDRDEAFVRLLAARTDLHGVSA